MTAADSPTETVLHIPDLEKRDAPAAKDMMTAPAIACREHAFFEEIAEILADRDISGMPVVDCDGRVVGVISERDLAHALGGPIVRLAIRRHNRPRLTTDIVDLPRSNRRAKEIMSVPPLTVQLRTPLEEIARLMRVHQVNRVPVLDGERLAGVVTRGDVLGAIGHIEHRTIDLDGPPVTLGSEGMDADSSLHQPGLHLQTRQKAGSSRGAAR